MANREIFEAHLNPVLPTAYRLAYRLTGRQEDAMDLVQDTVVQSFRRFDTFLEGSNFRAWFLRILTNRFYKELPKRKRAAESLNIEDAEDIFLYQKAKETGLYDTSADPASAVIDRLDAEAVHAAIDLLPEDYRDTVALFFLEEMAYEQIAETLEIPLGTVRSRIHRGRKLLQKALWNLAESRGLLPNVVEGIDA